jgi:3alpha(or 20beta)-hydroxysteroid dehydrogenase
VYKLKGGLIVGKLDDRVALVTGAARGMGASHARLLASEGAKVVVCDLNEPDGAAVAAGIGGTFQRLDVGNAEEWESVVETVGAQLGPITILINNAGIGTASPVHETPVDDWIRVMTVNVNGVFFGIRAVTSAMAGAGGGVIVNVSSNAGLVAPAHMAAYTTSKWAVRGLTRASALDLAPFNIRVCSLHPGIVRTPMTADIDLGHFTAKQSIPRPGEPEELAKMMLFIVADATYSTGCEFIADGGRTAGMHSPHLDR